VAPALVLLIALALRLYRLGDANLWWDEALAIWGVRKGLLGVTLWTAGDVHPPLYFWSLWGWVQLVGESEFAMRALSALFGVLTVAAVYRLGALAAHWAVGLLGALLTALARFHVWWSQEMRMYVLAGLLVVLSLHFYLRWIRRERSNAPPTASAWTSLALYALATTGALYTIFLTGIVVIVQNLLMVLVLIAARPTQRKRLALRWIGAQGVVAALTGIWLLFSWGRMPTWSVASPMSLRAFVQLWATLLTTGVSVDIGRYTVAAMLPLALILLGGILFLWRWWRQERALSHEMLSALGLALTTLLSGAAIYVATLPRGLFYTPRVEARYFVPFAPAFWLLLAWSLVLIWRRWRLAGSVAIVATMALWLAVLPGHYRDRIRRDELQSMARTILSQVEPGDAVVLDSGSRYPIFLYYYERIANDGTSPPMVTITRSEDPLTAKEVDEGIEALLRDHDRIWLAEVDVNITDPEHLVARRLEQALAEPVLATSFGHNTLYLYDRERAAPSLASGPYRPMHEIDLAIGGGRLRGWDLPVRRFGPGDSLRLGLLWEATPSEPVGLALCTEDGQTVTLRREASPLGGDERYQLLQTTIHEGVPAGIYRLMLLTGTAEEELATVRVVNTPAQPAIGPATETVKARLGEAIRLEGYSLHVSGHNARPGERLVLDLYWSATERPTTDYTVFTHLLGQVHNPRTQGPVWAGHDAQPAYGTAPTSQWIAGDHLVDRHILIIDDQAPPGEYRLEVGMYDAATGQRLPVSRPDGDALGDHLLLDTTVTVVSVD
jgi:hypothetical protein